jgi:hypothetical protein
MTTEKKKSILIAGGDSFTYGLDLLDCNQSNKFAHSQSTWPAHLSRHMNREYICTAYPGSSNNSISRKTIMACEEYLGNDLFVVVGWSFLNRVEFRFTISPYNEEFDLKKDPEGYYLGPYGPWISFNSKDLYKDIDTKDHNLIFKKLDPDISKFLKDYYKYIGSDDIYEYYATLKEIVLLQNYLKLKNIPFLFTANHAFFRKKIKDPTIDSFLKQIDFDHWFFYPHLNGFVDWAKEKGFPKRDEHFTEEAHLAAFDLIRDYLDQKN